MRKSRNFSLLIVFNLGGFFLVDFDWTATSSRRMLALFAATLAFYSERAVVRWPGSLFLRKRFGRWGLVQTGISVAEIRNPTRGLFQNWLQRLLDILYVIKCAQRSRMHWTAILPDLLLTLDNLAVTQGEILCVPSWVGPAITAIAGGWSVTQGETYTTMLFADCCQIGVHHLFLPKFEFKLLN